MKKNARLQIRLPKELKDWVQEYAKGKHTDVSTLVVRFFVRLRDADQERRHPTDADQV